MNTLNAVNYIADQAAAACAVYEIEDFSAYLADKETFDFHGTKCVVADQLIFGTVGICPTIPYGIAYFPMLDMVIMNTATKELPKHHLNAILWHELGHHHLEHEDIDQKLEHEADTYSVAHGCEMKATLIDMREKLLLPLMSVYPHLNSLDLDARIAAL